MDRELTRRRLLASAASAGTVGALAGGMAQSLSVDGEEFTARLDSGALELEVAWESRVTEADGTTTVERYPSQSGTFPSTFAKAFGRQIELPAVGPGDSGTITVAGRSCDNPGAGWVRLLGDESAELARKIEAEARIGACSDEGIVVASGSLADVLRELQSGVPFVAEVDTLGKVEYDDKSGTFSVDEDSNGEVVEQDDDSATIKFSTGDTVVVLSNFETKDGDENEIVALDIEVESGYGLSKATVKGATRTEEYVYACTKEVQRIEAPENPAGRRAGLSYLACEYCERCLECAPACLTIDWVLPADADLDGDETLSLRSDLYAEQCRHNPTPENPWS